MKLKSARVALLSVLLTWSCGDGEFTGNGGRPEQGGSLDNVPSLYIAGTENKIYDDADPVPVPHLLNGIRFDPGNISNTPGDELKLPLDIYFVLDVTASMTHILESIKNNIQTFASSLSQDFRPKFGGIAFRDGVVGSINLTADVNQFKLFVAQQRASGGNDQNESALLGIQQALVAISQQSRPEAAKAILVITDNPAHMANTQVIDSTSNEFNPSTTRDCTVTALANAIKSLPDLSRNLLQIYHSTGATNTKNLQKPCSGFNTATQQMDALLNQALRVNNKNPNVGGALSFPFNSATLINEFSVKLKQNRPAVEVACIAESATLAIDGTVVNSYKVPSLSESYKRYINKKTLDWANPVPESMKASLAGKSAKLNIRRCCIETAKAKAGQFNSCEYKNQAAEFKTYLPTSLN